MSLIFSGWVGGRKHGFICPLIVTSVYKGVYIKPHYYLLLPVLKRVQDTLGDSIFKQYNSPVHKAAVVKDIFKRYNIQV